MKSRVFNFLKRFQKESSSKNSGRICHSCRVDLQPIEGTEGGERCPECLGLWLSRSHLQSLVERVDVDADSPVELDNQAKQVDIANTYAPSRHARVCPECSSEMDNFRFEETGIWLDACLQGHGVWLDSGELRLITQRRQGQAIGGEELVDAVSDLILGNL